MVILMTFDVAPVPCDAWLFYGVIDILQDVKMIGLTGERGVLIKVCTDDIKAVAPHCDSSFSDIELWDQIFHNFDNMNNPWKLASVRVLVSR